MVRVGPRGMMRSQEVGTFPAKTCGGRVRLRMGLASQAAACQPYRQLQVLGDVSKRAGVGAQGLSYIAGCLIRPDIPRFRGLPLGRAWDFPISHPESAITLRYRRAST
jgi:hypothetical protein